MTSSTTSTPTASTNDEEYHLTQPTAEELHTQLLANSSEWKGALSQEAYLRREAHLLSQDLTRDNGLTAWFLVRGLGATRQVLCACESIRKAALVARNGIVEDVLCHGVASVFCPPEQRGRGYASRMIAMLGERLGSWQEGDAPGQRVLFGALWSDIGKQFYARHGWKVFPSAQLQLPPWLGSSSSRASLPVAQPVNKDGLVSLCISDQRMLRKRMARAAGEGKQIVAIVPDRKTIMWQHAREEFVSMELYGKVPEVKGAIVQTYSGKKVWCYWLRMWYNANPVEPKGNTMHILRLATDDVDYDELDVATEDNSDQAKASEITNAVASLLAAAQSEAAQWNMAEVEIWNPTSITLAATKMLDPSVKVTHREKDSISSLKWYGDASGQSPEDLQWIGNEKYCWC